MKNTKQFLVLLLALLTLLIASGCEKHTQKETQEKNDTITQEKKEVFDSEVVLSKLEITEYEGHQKAIYGDDYIFLIIKNNSNNNIRIKGTVTIYDENGEIVGMLDDETNGVAKGEEALLDYVFDKDYDLHAYGEITYDYKLEVSEVEEYKCYAKNIKCEITKAKDKGFATTTNETETDFFQIWGHILYYKNGEFVGYYENELASNIYPNESQIEEVDCVEDYDSYKVFFWAD